MIFLIIFTMLYMIRLLITYIYIVFYYFLLDTLLFILWIFMDDIVQIVIMPVRKGHLASGLTNYGCKANPTIFVPSIFISPIGIVFIYIDLK